MSYLELYRKRLNRDGSNIREKRLKDSRDALDRNFTIMNGYKECTLIESYDVNENYGRGKPFEVVIKSGTEELKKDLIFRPYVSVESGSYISIDDEDRTYIVNTINQDRTLPVAHCFLCNAMLKIKGCPMEFPIYENSTTFGTKGIVDNGGNKFLELDSKTRAYLQYNKFTERIPLGYRFIFKNRYVFSVTEIDHMVYGHFIMTMKITEKHPDDDFENGIAWNENDIDFTDLLGDKVQEEAILIEGSPSVKVGTTTDYFANYENGKWSYEGEGEIGILGQCDDYVTILGVSKGVVTLFVETNDGVSAYKNILIV